MAWEAMLKLCSEMHQASQTQEHVPLESEISQHANKVHREVQSTACPYREIEIIFNYLHATPPKWTWSTEKWSHGNLS